MSRLASAPNDEARTLALLLLRQCTCLSSSGFEDSNNVIRLPATPSLSKIEECLVSIGSAPNADLWLPTNVGTGGLFGWACLQQAIITWARRRGQGAVIVETDHNSNVNLVERVVHKPHGLVAALVAERIRSRAGIDQTLLFREAAAQELRVSQRSPPPSISQSLLPGLDENLLGNSPKRRGGFSIELCADGIGALASPRALYSFQAGSPIPRSSSEFGDWVTREFNLSFKKDAVLSARIDLPGLAEIGRAIAELFSNTHKWARTEIGDAWIRRSVRGIVTDAVRDVSEQFNVEEPGPIRDFLKGLSIRFEKSPNIGAMEISVFDSGPGLAQRWLGRVIDDSEDVGVERDAVSHCLQLWGTKGGAESRGLGLHTVMLNLSKPEIGGLLLIRTGRLSLCRDLNRHPLLPASDVSVNLADYHMSDVFPHQLARIEGTVISMILPMPGKPA